MLGRPVNLSLIGFLYVPGTASVVVLYVNICGIYVLDL